MFWRVASFNQASAVEAVLDRPDFTLEDLLEEDDLIQASLQRMNIIFNETQAPPQCLCCAVVTAAWL